MRQTLTALFGAFLLALAPGCAALQDRDTADRVAGLAYAVGGALDEAAAQEPDGDLAEDFRRAAASARALGSVVQAAPSLASEEVETRFLAVVFAVDQLVVNARAFLDEDDPRLRHLQTAQLILAAIEGYLTTPPAVE